MDKVSRLVNTFKIKLRALGLRLVYTVDNETNTLTVYAIGKRDKKTVCRKAGERI
jgi:mRNA interferase RelE/StbE